MAIGYTQTIRFLFVSVKLSRASKNAISEKQHGRQLATEFYDSIYFAKAFDRANHTLFIAERRHFYFGRHIELIA